MSAPHIHTPTAAPLWLTKLPAEVLLNICSYLTTPSFLLLTSTCRTLFHLPKSSRDLLLHHLNSVPGIILGLEDNAVSAEHLWLLLRQRASAYLYGANFNADCSSYAFQSGRLNAAASCLGDSYGDVSISLASYDGLESREFNSRCSPLGKLASPYGDGHGQIVQVVHHGNFISVLYAWQALSECPGLSAPSSLSTTGPLLRPAHPFCPVGLVHNPDLHLSSPSLYRYGCHPEPRQRSPSPPAERPETRYHLIHYDSHGLEPATFFTVWPPKPIKNTMFGNRDRRSNPEPVVLVPVHVAIYNRLNCAITWRESRLGCVNTTVIMLYVADKLPPFFEQGSYASFKLYPPRPPPARPAPPPPDHDPSGVDLVPGADTDEESRRIWRKDMSYFARHRTVATAFWYQGDRLAIYSCAQHVPFATAFIHHVRLGDPINVRLSRLDRASPDNHFIFDRPFYGKHFFSPYHHGEISNTRCIQADLRLAVLLDPYPDKQSGAGNQQAMCIYVTRFELPADECPHYYDVDTASDYSSRSTRGRQLAARAIARLWGWEPPSESPTTMSALDTVAISPAGTRIAISYWNKVLVWALDPDVLCEAWDQSSPTNSDPADSASETDHSAEFNANSNINNHHGLASDTESDAGSAAEPGGHAQHNQLHHGDAQNPANSPAAPAAPAASSGASLNLMSCNDTNRVALFYEMARDRRLGEIVELRPIVLHLPNGEVARKMQWRNPSAQENDNVQGGNYSSKRVVESDSDSSPFVSAPETPPPAPPAPISPQSHSPSLVPGQLGRVSRWVRCRGNRSRSRDDSHYSPIITSSYRADLDHGPDVHVSFTPSDEDEELESAEENEVSDSSFQTKSRNKRNAVKSTSKGNFNARGRHCTNKYSGSSKPSETWGMNKTMDIAEEEEDTVGADNGEGRELDKQRERNRVKKDKQKQNHKSADLIQAPVGEEDADGESEDDYMTIHCQHTVPHQLAAEELGRRRRLMKGKRPVRDPPVKSAHNHHSKHENKHNYNHNDEAEREVSANKDITGFAEIDSSSGSDNFRVGDRSRKRREKNRLKNKNKKKKKKRQTEDELVILTDRGIQVWNMGVWSTGRREESIIPEI